MAVTDYLRKRVMPHIWCPGCGHGTIMSALLRAVEKLELAKNDIVMISGIGCSARMLGYVDFHTMHTLHGRALAFGTGVKMARPDLTVIVPMGDGDALAIGGNHLIHAARRNIDITAIVMNNSTYGMTGGQGVVSAAIILGESALFHGGLNAVQTQVYGPEARGGSARSDLILADHEILFPKVLQPNVLVCLSQAAYDTYSSNVRPGGVVVTDSRLVRRWQHASSREIELPLHDTVTRELGTAQSINICLLGALVRLIPVVTVDAVAAVVTGRFPARFKNANLAALELGAGLVTESITTF